MRVNGKYKYVKTYQLRHSYLWLTFREESGARYFEEIYTSNIRQRKVESFMSNEYLKICR